MSRLTRARVAGSFSLSSLNADSRRQLSERKSELDPALELGFLEGSEDDAGVRLCREIGLIPDAGGSWFLVKKLGLARAMGCAMLGDKLSAADAKEWGMIWDVAPEGQDCVEAALQLAGRLAALPTRALVETRKLLRAAASNNLDAQLKLERDTQAALGRSHDYIEGVTAFLQKRPPDWDRFPYYY